MSKRGFVNDPSQAHPRTKRRWRQKARERRPLAEQNAASNFPTEASPSRDTLGDNDPSASYSTGPTEVEIFCENESEYYSVLCDDDWLSGEEYSDIGESDNDSWHGEPGNEETHNNESESNTDSDSGSDADTSLEEDLLTLSDNLYEGAPLTTGVSHTLIMMFGIKHKLTAAAFQDLIKLIELHCPKPNTCAKSLYLTKKYFADNLGRDASPTTYYCCSTCQKELANGSSKCDRPACRNSPATEFYYLDIELQIKRLFEDPLFRHNLRRHNEDVQEDGRLHDIYQGRAYKDLTKEGGFLANGKNITFAVNTDGVAIYTTSRNKELWPIYLCINELPPQLRFTKKYMVLCGFWCAAQKPKMSTFLRPLMVTLNKIHTEGIEVKVSSRRTEVIKGLLMVVLVDMPAKAKVIVMKQYNGEYGCNECEDPGMMLTRPHRVWPYAGPMTLRSHLTILANANATLDTEEDAVMGIMGASILTMHKPFDMATGLPVDYMHAVCSGAERTMADLWFSPQNSREIFYIGQHIPELNEQVTQLKVPDCLSHRPRSILDRHHWKASEWRSWMFYHSLPLVRNVLPATYVAHYYLLVSSIATLASDDIAESDLPVVEKRLDAFCKSFETLYGPRRQTMNIHKLRHLVMYVKLYGPLFTTSLFGCESMNGHLKRWIHGTRFIVTQITFTKTMSWAIQRLAAAMEKTQPTGTVKFARRLTGLSVRTKTTRLTSGLYCIGGVKKQFISDNHLEAIQTTVADVDSTIKHQHFYRVQLHGQTIYSQEYGREKKRNSRTVEFEMLDGTVRFGEVVVFCTIGTSHVAVLKELAPVGTPLVDSASVNNPVVLEALLTPLREQVIQVMPGNTYLAVPITSLRRKCVFMSIGDNSYVGKFPNVVEPD